jgi:uncharacterized SAM-binding protein YcdF (DUF218 family)
MLAGGALLASTVIWPPIEHPRRADAVVLLSGDGGRLPGAVRLMERGVASTLVFVGTPDTIGVLNICRGPQPFEVVCLHPRPDSTRAEARAAGRFARDKGWDSLVVVTSRYHLTRGRMLLRRCFGGTVHAVGDYPQYGREFARRQIVHELLALGHATFVSRGC